VKVSRKSEDDVSIAQGVFSFHTLKHHNGYNSMDCKSVLLKNTFPDSEVIIIIIIGTTTHKESWPPSEVSSTLLDSWLLPTNFLEVLSDSFRVYFLVS
jgi:hypothetical protein